MSAKVSLKIEASADALARIIDAVETLGKQEDWSPELLFTANLVLEELGLNVINHAYGGQSGEFEIIISSEAHSITVEIIDSGPPFDLLNDAPIPDVAASIEDRPVGGLGVHLVKTMMDEMSYKREKNRNHVTMVKWRDK